MGLIPQAVIYGCAGQFLSDWEKDFFKEQNPFGLILFRRNIETPDQVRALCESFRKIVADPNRPILIDQEGGRVARLRPPHWPALPAMAHIGQLYDQDSAKGEQAAYLIGQILGAMLSDLGINLDCAPVLDLMMPETHDVIGDRAFHADPKIVSLLGGQLAEGLLSQAVFPVMKHLPGHGRTLVDSHHDLPIITASAADLSRDHQPFTDLNHMLFGMSAHLLLTCYDESQPATLSKNIIQDVIREKIGFRNILMTDDISMKALGGSYASRTEKAYQAGCDLILHCNGNATEMAEIAEAAQDCSDLLWQRWQTELQTVLAQKEDQKIELSQAVKDLAVLLPTQVTGT